MKKFILKYMRVLPFVFLVVFKLTTLFLFIFEQEIFLIVAVILTAYQVFIVAYVGIYSFLGYQNIRRDLKVNWKEKYDREKKFDSLDWDDVVIYVIIPNYKEDVAVLEEMVNNLRLSDESAKSVIPVLAMEEREENHKEKASNIIAKFKSHFRDFIYTVHPVGIKDEVPGKSSNENWSVRELQHDINKNNYNENNVLVTISDADSLIHPNYFSAVIQKFCCDPKRHRITWQPPIVNFLNLHKVPVFSRIMSYVVTAEVIANLRCHLHETVPFSTYTLSFKTCKEVDFFDPKIIAEDEHMFLKCVFEYGDEYRCDSIYLPVECYSVGENKSYWDGVNERWKQAKRHMIAIHEVVFVLRETIVFLLWDKSKRKMGLVKWIKVFHRIAYPHFFSISCVWIGAFTTVLYPILMLFFDEWKLLWDSYWYYALQALIFLTGFFMVIAMFTAARVYSDMMINSAKGKLFRYYQFVKMMIEMAIFGSIAVVGFTYIPAIINFVKLLSKEKFEYEVATKTNKVATQLESVKIEKDNEK